jgi:hypothetical protein
LYRCDFRPYLQGIGVGHPWPVFRFPIIKKDGQEKGAIFSRPAIQKTTSRGLLLRESVLEKDKTVISQAAA